MRLKLKILIFSFLLFSNLSFSIDLDKNYDEASALIEEKKFKKALFIYEEILRGNFDLDTYKKSRIYNNIGYCYYRLKNYENAFIFYKKALEIDNNYFLCLNNISAVLMKQKKYKQALTYLKIAYALNKKYIKIIFNLFVVNAHLKDEYSAKYFLEHAFKIDKDYTIKRLKKNGISEAQIKKIQAHLFR